MTSPILTPIERQRMEELRTKDRQKIPLTEEKAELHALYQRIEDYEGNALRASEERHRQQDAERERRLTELEDLLTRKKQALVRLESLIHEIEALKVEEAHILALVSSGAG